MIKIPNSKTFFWLFLFSIIANSFLLYLYFNNTSEKVVNLEKKTIDFSPPKNEINRKGLISRIIEKGDVIAYDSLSLSFLQENNNVGFLPYALLMANKWNYPSAEFDVYSYLLFLYDCKGWTFEDQMDKKSRKIALEYLKLAAEKGHKKSNEIIRENYPELLKKMK